MNTLALTGAQPSPTSDADPKRQKLEKTGREFEAVLIQTLWKSLHENSFGDGLGGDEPSPGMDSISDMAGQAFSSALAARGGLGIAKMIVDHYVAKTGGDSGTGTPLSHGTGPVESKKGLNRQDLP